jgi:ATP-dependent protease Clp ATPase subunit
MLTDIMFEIPDIKGKKELVITKDIVKHEKKLDVNSIIKALPEQIETA